MLTQEGQTAVIQKAHDWEVCRLDPGATGNHKKAQGGQVENRKNTQVAVRKVMAVRPDGSY